MVVAGKSKGRTGLEWLLEKGLPKKAEENGSAGAAAPAAPDATGLSDEDRALALLDVSPGTPAASTVLSKAPAASSLALDADTSHPSTADSPANKRGLDAIANALALEEPVSEEDAAKARTSRMPAARKPDEPEGVKAKAAIPTPPPPPADEKEEEAAPSAAIEDDHSGGDEEPSLPPAEPPAPLPTTPTTADSAAIAAHKKAVLSGRSTRAFPRVNVPFEARFKKGSDAVTASGRNVSIGGFFVETKKLLPEGEVFQAQLFFTQRDRKLSVIAEVMWATMGDPEDTERFPPGMGCKFLDVDERDAPFIQGLIDSALAAGGGTPA